MIVFEGMVAAVVGVALLAAVLQFAGVAPSGARGVSTIAQPTVLEPIFKEPTTISGPITFVRNASDLKKTIEPPIDAYAYSKDGLKIDCSAVKVSALDTAGRTVGSTLATKGPEPGTCSYSMRIPANVDVTLVVTDGGNGAVWAAAGASDDLKLKQSAIKWRGVTADKWTTLKNGSDAYIKIDRIDLKMSPNASLTVPLSVSIAT